MSEMEDKMAAWESEVKRQRETYGPDAEIPTSPYGQMTAVPEAPPARIARLAKEVAEAGEHLAGARVAYEKALRNQKECLARFACLSEDLMQAIHEHREGTPEGKAYPR